MKLRPLLALLPFLAILKLTACSDNGDTAGAEHPPTGDEGGSDGPIKPPGSEGGTEAGTPGKHGTCAITKEGTAGVLITGRLLLPDAPINVTARA